MQGHTEVSRASQPEVGGAQSSGRSAPWVGAAGAADGPAADALGLNSLAQVVPLHAVVEARCGAAGGLRGRDEDLREEVRGGRDDARGTRLDIGELRDVDK